MKYIEIIQQSIEYIEENLGQNLALDKLAEQVFCSKYHFHRLFHSMVGMPVFDYIRKRRLSEAARMLKETDMQINYVAAEWGFNSQIVFCRAFKKLYGKSPYQFRKYVSNLSFFNRISLSGQAAENIFLPYLSGPQIIFKDSIKVVGATCRSTIQENMDNDIIPKFWGDFEVRLMKTKIQADRFLRYGIAVENPDGSFSYMAALDTAMLDNIPDWMHIETIPASKFLVFTLKGMATGRTSHDAFAYIFSTWIPRSGYVFEENGITLMEAFDERFSNDACSEFDIYIPIK